MALIVTGGSLAALACSGSTEAPEGGRIFEGPPWTGAERFVYELEVSGLDGDPFCELLTKPGTSGTTTLEEHCENGPYRDDSVVTVDSETLLPLRSERAILDDEEPATHTINYGPDTAIFSTSKGESRNETTRELPTPTEEYPEPGWYDDKSIFWLVRGLPLAEGYESSYVHVINVGAPRVLSVKVEVDGTEAVQTPYGTVQTWKVRLERDNTVYFLWVEKEAPHIVAKARIEGVTYNLIAAE